MGAGRIFPGGGIFVPKKVADLFSGRPQNTGKRSVTANTQNTLQHFQGQVPPCPCLRAPMQAANDQSFDGFRFSIVFSVSHHSVQVYSSLPELFRYSARTRSSACTSTFMC